MTINEWQRIPSETAGQVLTSNGADDQPTFQELVVESNIPVGSLFEIFDDDAVSKDGWLPCEETLYLQSTYPELFLKVGLLELYGYKSTPLGFNVQLLGIHYHDGLYVVVGGGGFIATSTDYTNWTQQTSGTTNGLRRVSYGDGVWFACGNNVILSSTDAITWNTTETTTTEWWGTAYLNGNYVVVGNGVAVSTDAITWNVSLVNNFGGHEITYGNGLYVSSGNSGIVLISTDLTTWDDYTLSAAGNFSGIAFGDGIFITVGGGQTAYFSETATDANSWASFPSGGLGITYNGTIFGWVGGGSQGVVIEGDNVSRTVYTDDFNTPIWDITWNGERFVCAGDEEIVYSTDFAYDTNTEFLIPSLSNYIPDISNYPQSETSVYIKHD